LFRFLPLPRIASNPMCRCAFGADLFQIVRQALAASEPQTRIMAATASSANQLASKSTIAPGINFFMAISQIIHVLAFAFDMGCLPKTG